MNKSLKFEFSVYCEDYVQAGVASSEIKKYLHQLGINKRLVRKIVVASYEAEMNIVIHSIGGKITLEILHKEIILTSKDRGPGIDNIDLALTPGYTTASSKAREMGFGAGMGLPNMKKNADGFEIKSSVSGTMIKMKFNFSM